MKMKIDIQEILKISKRANKLKQLPQELSCAEKGSASQEDTGEGAGGQNDNILKVNSLANETRNKALSIGAKIFSSMLSDSKNFNRELSGSEIKKFSQAIATVLSTLSTSGKLNLTNLLSGLKSLVSQIGDLQIGKNTLSLIKNLLANKAQQNKQNKENVAQQAKQGQQAQQAEIMPPGSKARQGEKDITPKKTNQKLLGSGKQKNNMEAVREHMKRTGRLV